MKREGARQWIALMVVSALAFIVISSFVSLWVYGAKSIDDVVKVIEAVTSPVIGIVGAVTGFYFGESQKTASSTDRISGRNE